ncbi:membrane-associating domain-containing protein [Morchella snyderi]|nr:membrane-associating domain-containing protein [Morchella snyderi]
MPSATKVIHIILRTLQFIFTVLVLALAGALIQQQTRGGTPTRVNYSIFVAAFAAVTHLYLFPATVVNRIASPLLMTILDAFNTIFYLCAGIAMAAQLNGNSCKSFHFIHNNGITNGGGYVSQSRRCREANAMTAFEWFAFAAFLGSLLIDLWNLKNQNNISRGRVNMKGVRPMSQSSQPVSQSV